jgi:predicted RecA/RadA family phage recombinase
MAQSYLQAGDIIQFTAASTIDSGDVVPVGNQQLGVALVDIATSATGSVAIQGVFELKKNTSDAIVIGQKLWWNATAKEVINEPAINAWFIGYAFKAAGASAPKAHVQLAPFTEEGTRTLTLAATGAQTLNVGDFGGGELIVFAPNTAAQTVNLPSVATIPPGTKLFVRKTDATAQAVTLDPAGSEQIAGGATFATIDANNDLAEFVSNGAAWALVRSVIA